MPKHIVIVGLGEKDDIKIGHTLVNGSKLSKPWMRPYFDTDSAKLDISRIESDMQGAAIVLLVPCVQSRQKDSKVHRFECELIERCKRSNIPLGVATRLLNFVTADHILDSSDVVRIIISPEKPDETGEMRTLFPLAQYLEMPNSWSTAKVVQDIFRHVD